MLNGLFSQFSDLIFFDTETTGINPRHNEIIEFGGVRVSPDGEKTELDVLIKLPAGKSVPPEITRLTGITQKMLDQDGLERGEAFAKLSAFLTAPQPLLLAYNAQFDLCFLYYFLSAHGGAKLLKNAKFLDVLTVYKDRRDYPHKLEDAIAAYFLDAVNSHRASDDAAAAYELLCAMETERGDIEKYINLFGYNPKYGVSGPRISSVTYAAQPYTRNKLLYE